MEICDYLKAVTVKVGLAIDEDNKDETIRLLKVLSSALLDIIEKIESE